MDSGTVPGSLGGDAVARRERTAALDAEIASMAGRIHAASYRLVAMLGEFEALGGWEGWPTPAHWLQWRCGFSLGAAREKFRVARALPQLPRIRVAFERGELSFAKVRAITRVATPENEGGLAAWAPYATASQLERLARLYRRHGENAAVERQHRERALSHWEEDDGSVVIRVRLPAEQAAVVMKAIESAKETLGEVAGDVSAETRRAAAADGLLRMAEAWFEPDGRPRSIAEKYQVHVHLDLRREGDGPFDDPESPALAEETIRRLGCEAGLVPVWHDGEEILSVGRRTRAVPPAIRRALRLRDRGCRFPGCTRTRHVDAHHVHHWADGGETKLSNLVELCGFHHRLLHEGGYGLTVARDGTLVFTRPDGERIPEVPTRATAGPDLGVSAETPACLWDGAQPDYGAMIEALDLMHQARAGPGSVATPAPMG